MRLKFLLLLFLVVAFISDVSAAKDRKRNRNKGRNNEESVVEGDDESRTGGGGFSLTEERRKETKDRVMTLVEREEERKKDREDKESSEEKDDKRGDEAEGKNSTEVVIPVRRFRRTHQDLSRVQEINDGELKPYRHRAHHRRRRHEHTLKKTAEINDGVQQPVDNKPSQDHKCGPDCKHTSRKRRAEIERHEVRLRHRRQGHTLKTLKKAAEINDGLQTAVDTKPSQDHQCGPNCNHPARLRRVKAKGGKDVGHRAASHPHMKNNARGAGKRRNQQNVNHVTGGRKPRHLKTIPEVSEENTEETEGLKSLQSPEGKAFTYSRKYIRVHGKRPPALPEDEQNGQVKEVPTTIRAQRKRVSRTVSSAFPDDKDSKDPYDYKDRTLVAADAGEIREII